MRTPHAEPRVALLFVVLAVAVTAALLVATDESTHRVPAPSAPSSWRGLVGSRPSASPGDRVIVVLRTPSLAERVAAAGGEVDIEREQAWTKVAQSAQKLLLSRLALRGVAVHVELSFTRVLDGFSAELPPSVIPVVERDRAVAGVYPVRVAYPASLSVRSLDAAAPSVPGGLTSAGIDGRGVTVALLDTGVDRSIPILRGRVLPGIGVAGDAASPDDHGTEMAGVIARAAPGAAVLPIRVATTPRSETSSRRSSRRTGGASSPAARRSSSPDRPPLQLPRALSRPVLPRCSSTVGIRPCPPAGSGETCRSRSCRSRRTRRTRSSRRLHPGAR